MYMCIYTLVHVYSRCTFVHMYMYIDVHIHNIHFFVHVHVFVLAVRQLVRFPTPFRRDMNKKKKKLTKYKPGATPTTTIFKKGSSQVHYMLCIMYIHVHTHVHPCHVHAHCTCTCMYIYTMYMYIHVQMHTCTCIHACTLYSSTCRVHLFIQFSGIALTIRFVPSQLSCFEESTYTNHVCIHMYVYCKLKIVGLLQTVQLFPSHWLATLSVSHLPC